MSDVASGLLLHPTIGSNMDASTEFQDHRIRFAAIAPAASALNIRKRLLQVIQVPFAATASDMAP